MDEVHRQPRQPASPNGNGSASAGGHRRSAGGRSAPAAALALPRPARATAKPVTEVPLCAKCAALCCRYVALPIDNPETAHDYDNIRWYLMHENIHVFVDDGEWYIAFATRCKNLADDNRCNVYETRPRVCRGYDTSNCEYHGTEYRYEHMFTSADQLQRYAEEELGLSMIFKPRRKKPKLKRGRDGRRRVELPLA